MNAYKRMLNEYVYPFVIVTVLMIPIFVMMGRALDREISFQEQMENEYR